jgi:hypothetical protein
MDPELVADLQVGYGRDGEGVGGAVRGGAGDADVYAGPYEIEAGVRGQRGPENQ